MSKIPSYVTALFFALQFQNAEPEGLRRLGDDEWNSLLGFCDQMHLTLRLRQLTDYLPDWVRTRIERNLADNAERFETIKADYIGVAAALREAGVDHLVLKGFAHWPVEMQHPRCRMQSDLDLLCPDELGCEGYGALQALGYKTVQWTEHFPSDQHLPTLLRDSNWRWHDNYFDPELPVAIDLHVRFWNEVSAGFAIEGLEQFWQRRESRRIDEISFPALTTLDSLGYSTLHGLRHLLCNSLSVHHVYEVAWFLDLKAGDGNLWKGWHEQHHESLRQAEATVFSLAELWFGCRMNTAVREEIDRLPANVRRWIRAYGYSPLDAMFGPNKDSLWLHLSLLKSPSQKRAILRKRLFGAKMPPVAAFEVERSGASESWVLQVRRIWKQRTKHVEYVTSRAFHHARTLPPTLARGFMWWLGEASSE
jgi:Uncharacterised nucleotidyltransferase